jgi:hypothetical protein
MMGTYVMATLSASRCQASASALFFCANRNQLDLLKSQS